MNTERYILRFKGASGQANEELREIEETVDLKVVDDSMSPKTVLVEAPEDVIAGIRHDFINWHVIPERPVKLPDSRQRVTANASKKSSQH